MKAKLEKAMARGWSIKDLANHCFKETLKRCESAKEGAAKEVAKYPEVVEALKGALVGFEVKVAEPDWMDAEMLAHDVITGQLNPMMNLFQHVMVRQAEMVALRRLAQKMQYVRTVDDLVEAFATPEPTGSFFERQVMQCAAKVFPKIANTIGSLPANR